MMIPEQEKKLEIPETDNFSNESFDYSLRIVSMPTEKLIALEEKGKIKNLAEYE